MSYMADNLPAWETPSWARSKPAHHSHESKAPGSLVPRLQNSTETEDLVGQAASSAFCKAEVSIVAH